MAQTRSTCSFWKLVLDEDATPSLRGELRAVLHASEWNLSLTVRPAMRTMSKAPRGWAANALLGLSLLFHACGCASDPGELSTSPTIDSGSHTPADALEPLQEPFDPDALCDLSDTTCRSVDPRVGCCHFSRREYDPDRACLRESELDCGVFLWHPPDSFGLDHDGEQCGIAQAVACLMLTDAAGSERIFLVPGIPTGVLSYTGLIQCGADMEQQVINAPPCTDR